MDYYIFGILVFYVVLFIFMVRRVSTFSDRLVTLIIDNESQIESYEKEKLEQLQKIVKILSNIEKSRRVSEP